MKLNICVVTGTRAEYGLLKPLLEHISPANEMILRLIVTGAHLCIDQGMTFQEIERDGFKIDKKIEILMDSDSVSSVCKSISLAILGFTDYFDESKPDLLIILGDRYEIFAAATVAAMNRIPIAHIHGGETTEGSLDEFFRHAITKMSYLHFVSNVEHAKRVIQLGESPDRVFNVGALGIENIKHLKLYDREEVEAKLSLPRESAFALVTFHPATNEGTPASEQIKELLGAINKNDQVTYVFTKANADAEGRIINNMIERFVTEHPQKARLYANLGQILYLSAMKECSIVIGNSSSGIIEAPYFGVPTVNIGTRQQGRMQAMTIINCLVDEASISVAIKTALNKKNKGKLQRDENIYGDGNTSDKIITVIKNTFSGSQIELRKKFFDLSASSSNTMLH